MGLGAIIGAVAGPALGAAASVYSAKQQSNAVKDSNRINTEEAAKDREFQSNEAARSMDFSAKEAATQRDFQERMSSTSFQRGVSDMKSAGINPLFAMDKGGASTPSGASGSGASGSGSKATVLPVPSVAMNAISTARDLASTYVGLKQALANTELSKVQAKKAGVETGILKDNSQERAFYGGMFRFLNGVVDRLSGSSAFKAFRKLSVPGDKGYDFNDK